MALVIFVYYIYRWVVEFTIMFIVCVCKHKAVCGDVHCIHHLFQLHIAGIVHIEEFMFNVMYQNTQCGLWMGEHRFEILKEVALSTTKPIHH